MIIDSHSHWLPEEIIASAHFFSRAWGNIESQIAAMESFGIDRALLTYPTSDAQTKLGGLKEVCRIYNSNLSQIVKRYPEKFIGAAILPVGEPQEMLDTLKESVEEYGFKAVSLATSYDGVYLDDPVFIPAYKYASEKGLPLFVHSQIVNPIGSERVKDPLLTPVIEYVFDTTICIGKLLMSEILKDNPGLKFVFAHFGGVTAFLGYRYDATYRMLRGINFVKDLGEEPTALLKKFYVDTSGDTQAINLNAALSMFGAEHILWGSDWPAKPDLNAGVRAIRDLEIGNGNKERILGGNLKNLFGL